MPNLLLKVEDISYRKITFLRASTVQITSGGQLFINCIGKVKCRNFVRFLSKRTNNAMQLEIHFKHFALKQKKVFFLSFYLERNFLHSISYIFD